MKSSRGKHKLDKKREWHNVKNPANKVNRDAQQIADKKNKVKPKKKLTYEQIVRRKKVRITILVIVIIAVLLLGIIAGVKANSWKNLVEEMSRNQNSVVKDTDGNTIATIGSEKAKTTISANDIPQNLKNAYISIEDERYYKHHGVDMKRTAGAIVTYVFHRNSSYGGSTITQQVVKNITGDSSNKVSRKVKEWGKALVLDSSMSKDDILALYFNLIYVGPNIYGVETGANYYFNKSVKDLSLEECAFLAGINNSPNSYNPFDGSNSEKIKKRTKTVLSKMLELKYIDQSSYDIAVQNVEAGLKFKKGTIKTDDAVYSYHTDALITQLTDDICKSKNISKTFATNYINMAGLTINSTQDSKIQSQMETEYAKTKYQLKSANGGDHSQSAMVIIDQKTGNVVGCVGGLGKKTESRGLNRATQTVRQTGSCTKPIAVLVPGISKKIFTGSTIFSDKETFFEDGYKPVDYSNYLGDITVRRALESSQNIPFVEMMEKIGPKTSVKYLKEMGITTITKNDENLALALGGLEKGISPLQMAGAYATIANDGVYIEPTFYTSAETQDKKVRIKANQSKKRVISKDSAFVIKELLTQPVKGTYGTAKYCAISGIDVAAKTGTTDENYDRWLCGFTPYYTAVTWYGYDQNETVNYGGNRNPAGIIWANIMARVHSNLKNARFEKPSSVAEILVCGETGKKARTGCKNVYSEYFLPGTVPELCTTHTGDVLNSNGASYNQSKPSTSTNSFDMTTTNDLDVPPVRTEETTTETTTTVTNEPSIQNTTRATNTGTEIENTQRQTTREQTTTQNITRNETSTTNTTSRPRNQETQQNTSSSTNKTITTENISEENIN